MIFITLAPSSSGRTHSLPSDGDRERTLEQLEMIGYHTLCGQARKQLSR